MFRIFWYYPSEYTIQRSRPFNPCSKNKESEFIEKIREKKTIKKKITFAFARCFKNVFLKSAEEKKFF